MCRFENSASYVGDQAPDVDQLVSLEVNGLRGRHACRSIAGASSYCLLLHLGCVPGMIDTGTRVSACLPRLAFDFELSARPTTGYWIRCVGLARAHHLSRKPRLRCHAPTTTSRSSRASGSSLNSARLNFRYPDQRNIPDLVLTSVAVYCAVMLGRRPCVTTSLSSMPVCTCIDALLTGRKM